MRGHVIKNSLKLLFGALLLIISLFPVYWLFVMAVQPSENLKTPCLYPAAFTADNFISLFAESGFLQPLKNSVIITLISLLFSLTFGLAAAYILARRRFSNRWKSGLSFYILIIRILPPVAFTIPLYTMFNRTGTLKTLFPMIMACILINLPMIIWFILGFFRQLPEEVEESAMIDGATEWQLYCRIVLPLVLPGIAAVAMLSFMSAWNEYTYSIIFVQSPQKYTIPLALAALNSGAISASRTDMYNAVHVSDNAAYSRIAHKYGMGYLSQWWADAGNGSFQADAGHARTAIYAFYSPRQLARLWLHNKEYFESGDTGAMVGSWFESPNASVIYSELHSTYLTRSKAGWIPHMKNVSATADGQRAAEREGERVEPQGAGHAQPGLVEGARGLPRCLGFEQRDARAGLL